MSRASQYVSWFTVLLFVAAAMHVYFWWRLVHATELPRTWTAVLTTLLIILAISFPAPFFANRYFSTPWREIAMWTGYIWMGFAFLLFVGLFASEFLRLGLWALISHNPAQRLFVSRSIASGPCVLALGAGGFAILNAARGPVLRRIRIAMPHTPEKLSGTTIAQISDVHVGGILGRRYLEGIVRTVNALHPDIVAITGDLVDGSAERHAGMLAPIGELKATYGVFFVTGNHEYYSGVEPWLAELGRLGVRILRNERVRIGNDREGFDLAGVDDPTGRLWSGHGTDIPGAMQGRDPERDVILLSHNPVEVATAAMYGVNLQLSGHTHGGQIWPFNFIVRLFVPYVSGLTLQGNTRLYVNTGTGFWGPPMRLGSRSEISLIELVAGGLPVRGTGQSVPVE